MLNRNVNTSNGNEKKHNVKLYALSLMSYKWLARENESVGGSLCAYDKLYAARIIAV